MNGICFVAISVAIRVDRRAAAAAICAYGVFVGICANGNVRISTTAATVQLLGNDYSIVTCKQDLIPLSLDRLISLLAHVTR